MSKKLGEWRINRSNWTGKKGTVVLYADGTLDVEDLGSFRIIEDQFTPDEGHPSWDYFGWKVVSADGQWPESVSLGSAGVFRRDIDNPDKLVAGATSYLEHRAFEVARHLWNTV